MPLPRVGIGDGTLCRQRVVHRRLREKTPGASPLASPPYAATASRSSKQRNSQPGTSALLAACHGLAMLRVGNGIASRDLHSPLLDAYQLARQIWSYEVCAEQRSSRAATSQGVKPDAMRRRSAARLGLFFPPFCLIRMARSRAAPLRNWVDSELLKPWIDSLRDLPALARSRTCTNQLIGAPGKPRRAQFVGLSSGNCRDVARRSAQPLVRRGRHPRKTEVDIAHSERSAGREMKAKRWNG